MYAKCILGYVFKKKRRNEMLLLLPNSYSNLIEKFLKYNDVANQWKNTFPSVLIKHGELGMA